ncbi:MAG: YciI family protein [Terracidiphilus sp.]
MLRQDEILRNRGALMAAVKTDVVTVTAWEGTPTVTEGAFAEMKVPLAGFSIIEAADVDEVVRLVAKTPCARARGAIEIRPVLAINDFVLSEHSISLETRG